MYSNGVVGFSDGDRSTLAEIVHDVQAAQAEVEAAQARLARAHAKAYALATSMNAGVSASVKRRDMTLRSIAAEIAGAVGSTDRAVQRRISDAVTLVEEFPATFAAWERGDITRAHTLLVTDIGTGLPLETRERFEAAALNRCEQEVPGRLRGELEQLAQRLHPRTLTERHAEAVQTRTVSTFRTRDGMGGLTIIDTVVKIEAAYDRLTRQAVATVDARTQARDRMRARAVRDESAQAPGDVCPPDCQGSECGCMDALVASDTRTMDQLRADLLMDMVLTGRPTLDPTKTGDGHGALGAIRAKVQVVVSALTLMGLDEQPAELDGMIPIDADTARAIAGATDEAWIRVLTHPITGAVLDTDTRFAQGPLRNRLRARDRRCRWPGCRVPAKNCEADHIIDHALGGPTTLDNCQMLCQRHHSMKQFAGWTVRHIGEGRLEWTSPLGDITPDDVPAPGVRFLPDDADLAPF
ncbi:HNH endonuclease signature motif containing protein [Microbacterium sp. GXF7504]